MFDFEWLRKFFVSFGERTKVTPIGFEAPRTEMKHERNRYRRNRTNTSR